MTRLDDALARGFDPYDDTLGTCAGECSPALMQAIRRASTFAAEARQRDAARRAEEERGETARKWALGQIVERRCGT